MQKEYLFYNQETLDFPLDESIDVKTKLDEIDYLISNDENANSEVYAPEINLYAKYSLDNIADKIKNIKKLYDIRANSFDLAQDLDYEQAVGKKLLIVSNEDNEDLVESMSEDGFTCISFNPEKIVDVNGTIGKLSITIKQDDELLDLVSDQVIWFDAPQFATKQNGVFDPNKSGLDEVIQKVKSNDGSYKYKNYIKYDSTICQYHERRQEICGRCADVCPTVAIVKIDEQKHLDFSHVDCLGCGGCISICPSGALDYSQMPRISFSQLSSFYEDEIALIVPKKMKIENLDIDLKEGALPLAIEGEKYLHEAHFLTLLQRSGNPIIFYTDFLSKGSKDAISFINEIFSRKYNKKAIFTCKDSDELKEAFVQIETLNECKYDINQEDLRKREIFSARLSHLVGEEDLGILKTGENIHYGNLTINQDTCTLCLSCVGACNVRALTAHPEDNTLRFDPSICTNCGYCEPTCPEKDCLHVVYDELSLNQNYFKQNIMAKDEIFKCIECGVGFATTKAVEKIAAMMKPIFAGDDIKIKTLYCCANCKPKVILQAQIDGEMK